MHLAFSRSVMRARAAPRGATITIHICHPYIRHPQRRLTDDQMSSTDDLRMLTSEKTSATYRCPTGQTLYGNVISENLFRRGSAGNYEEILIKKQGNN